MFMANLISSVDELRLRLQGGAHEAGDDDYEDTCTLFNTMIDRRPRLVVECIAVDDVVAAVAFTRLHELPIAVRAGGGAIWADVDRVTQAHRLATTGGACRRRGLPG